MSRTKADNTWQYLPAETEAKAAASRSVVLRLRIILLQSVNVCDEKALVQSTYIDIHVHRSCLTNSQRALQCALCWHRQGFRMTLFGHKLVRVVLICADVECVSVVVAQLCSACT